MTDPDIKREMRYDGTAHHFSGQDGADPGYIVLKCTTDSNMFFIEQQTVRDTL